MVSSRTLYGHYGRENLKHVKMVLPYAEKESYTNTVLIVDDKRQVWAVENRGLVYRVQGQKPSAVTRPEALQQCAKVLRKVHQLFFAHFDVVKRAMLLREYAAFSRMPR